MIPQSFQFSSVKRRKVEVDFSGGDITSNAGILLLSEIDRRIGLSRSVARAMGDGRRKASCEHSVEELLKQRVYALALGYEDLNDHKELRHDLALQTAVSRDKPLSSTATLSRFESRANRDTAIAIHKVLFDQFIASYDKPPKRLILDFDATDTPLHGEQEGRFFHGYYDHYCYLPLYVFC
ncbi:transposase, partial [Pseudomaricurvus hydrocarbonicus]